MTVSEPTTSATMTKAVMIHPPKEFIPRIPTMMPEAIDARMRSNQAIPRRAPAVGRCTFMGWANPKGDAWEALSAADPAIELWTCWSKGLKAGEEYSAVGWPNWYPKVVSGSGCGAGCGVWWNDCCGGASGMVPKLPRCWI